MAYTTKIYNRQKKIDETEIEMQQKRKEVRMKMKIDFQLNQELDKHRRAAR